LWLLARNPDTLIRRKLGLEEAEEASRRADHVLSLGWPRRPEGQEAVLELDAWLRARGNQRNPGATADLVTASLFVALREGTMQLPFDRPWTTT
jgi:triphosphoribosyl-dephospho-CoA synthase